MNVTNVYKTRHKIYIQDVSHFFLQVQTNFCKSENTLSLETFIAKCAEFHKYFRSRKLKETLRLFLTW